MYDLDLDLCPGVSSGSDCDKLALKLLCAQVQITFPVQLGTERASSEALWVSLCCKLLEQRLLRKLRFESGGVYTCAVSPFFGCEAPSWRGPLRGDIAISFSCDPAAARRLSEMAMVEVEVLQSAGPDADEVATVLNLEARSHENEVQENGYWLEVRPCRSPASCLFPFQALGSGVA